ncbi:MAG: SDR family oxidoreductase [Verrucomicrobia bacterium]|jgi:3-oxoacyl-[acyl-carrier protein] reductase|nr:SDR family oxidoreductase [Verrucomicrobiota bacterium]
MALVENNALEGRFAIVTGASRGIGRAIAIGLAAHGCGVMLAARDEAAMEDVRGEIEAAGGRACTTVCDMGDEASVVALVADTLKAFGRLDVLVNNAGFGIYGPMESSNTTEWDAVMAVNARGPYILCREAVPHLRKQSLAHIVNIGSVVSVKGYAEQAIYTASKHALQGMTKALAREVQSDGIRVHALCPGGVDTELVSKARPDLDRSVLMHPEEIADIVLFLVTRRGNAIIDEISVRRASSMPWA